MLRLLIVDDHPLFRDGLASVVGATKGVEVVGEAGSAREALHSAAQSAPDLITLDIALPGTSGMSVLGDLRRTAPKTKVLMLTMYADPAMVAEAFAGGAKGYALKTQDPDEIVEAIRAVARGDTYLAPGLPSQAPAANGHMPSSSEPLRGLSRREREIFGLIVRGFSTEAIGQELFISPKTVETHRARINKKLGTHSAGDLVRHAYRHGLLREG